MNDKRNVQKYALYSWVNVSYKQTNFANHSRALYAWKEVQHFPPSFLLLEKNFFTRLGVLVVGTGFSVVTSLLQAAVAASASAAATLPSDVQDFCEKFDTTDDTFSKLAADPAAESGDVALDAVDVPRLLLRFFLSLDLLRLRRSLDLDRSILRASRRAPRVFLRTR